MKNILVTGSNGQLGSEIKAIADNYHDFRFYFTDVDELDLTDKSAVADFFAQNNIDVCINCAAYTAVDKAEDEKELALKINRDAVETLAKNCQKNQSLLVHISTDYVFNGMNYKPYTEEDVPSPESYYGLTKLQGEKAALTNDKTVILRTAWLYSKYGNNFVKTMLRLGREKDKIGVVVDQIGTPTYAGDLAKAILQIVTNYDEKKGKIYHFSNEGAISWFDFAKAIMMIKQFSCEVNPIESKDFPAKANRPFYSVLNKSKVKKDYQVVIPYWLDSLKLVLEEL
jgi:dTDP-4-dehydrorhamnose reductase